jgi:hypothetical protein
MSVAAADIRNEVNVEVKRLALVESVGTKVAFPGQKGAPIYTRGDIVQAGTLVVNLLTLGLAGAVRDQIREDMAKDRQHIAGKASSTLSELNRGLAGATSSQQMTDELAARYRGHIGYARTLITILSGRN